MKRSIERVLTVIGAVVVLVVGLDAISYAATGKAFILGGTNTTTKTTVIKNTGSGSVLSLQTKSKGTPPLIVNSTGVIKNLDSDYLNGLHASQIQKDAIGPMTFTFNRTDAPTADLAWAGGTIVSALESNAGGQNMTYGLTGTITYPCNPATGSDASDEYIVHVYLLDQIDLTQVTYQTLPATSCGKPYTLPVAKVAMTSTAQLIVEVQGMNGSAGQYFPSTMTTALTGTPQKADL